MLIYNPEERLSFFEISKYDLLIEIGDFLKQAKLYVETMVIETFGVEL